MLWVKAFHVIFMVTWFAGLFYLPRLFVYHVDCTDEIGHDRFVVMERKLFAIMTLGAILTWFFGLWLLVAWHWPLSEHWLQAKLLLVVILSVYHIHTAVVVKRFKTKTNHHSGRFFRWYNEVPALILIGAVLLAVIRPT
jgi:putative membrane protein